MPSATSMEQPIEHIQFERPGRLASDIVKADMTDSEEVECHESCPYHPGHEGSVDAIKVGHTRGKPAAIGRWSCLVWHPSRLGEFRVRRPGSKRRPFRHHIVQGLYHDLAIGGLNLPLLWWRQDQMEDVHCYAPQTTPTTRDASLEPTHLHDGGKHMYIRLPRCQDNHHLEHLPWHQTLP